MKIFWRLLILLFRFRWQMLLAILLGCATVMSNIGLLSMAAYVISAAALAPLLVTLSIPIYVVRFMGVSRAGGRYSERVVSHSATLRLLSQLRAWAYSCLEPLAPAYLHSYRSGDILARLLTDIDELQNVYVRIFSPFIVAILIGAVLFGGVLFFDVRLAWVALAFYLAVGLFLPLLAGLLAGRSGKQQLALRAELNSQIVDGVQGIQDLLAYGQEENQQRKVVEINRALGRIQQRMASITGVQQTFNDLLMNLALWMMLILAIPLVAAKTLDGVYLAFLVLLVLASFEGVQPLAPAFQTLGRSLAAGKRLFCMSDTRSAVQDPVIVQPISTKVAHMLCFEGVSFAYSATDGDVLHDLDVCIHAGEHIAIIGASGAGKSTVANLILRFWDPTVGIITLDGLDIRQYAADEVRDLIGVVAQDTYLFNNTVRNNLLLACPDASEHELELALEQAQLTECIAQLPQGLDTWIGEQGLRLSGGERQRLAIARALLKNASILILDEATANLDASTERALLSALDTLMQGRTVLMITHRLIAMERMDQILMLDHGRICERGTHEQLLLGGVRYQQLFDLQNNVLVLP